MIHVEHDTARDAAKVRAQRPVHVRSAAECELGCEPLVARDALVPLEWRRTRIGEDAHNVRAEEQCDEHVEDNDARHAQHALVRKPQYIRRVVYGDNAEHEDEHRTHTDAKDIARSAAAWLRWFRLCVCRQPAVAPLARFSSWHGKYRGGACDPKPVAKHAKLRIPCVGPWEHSVRRP